jgi:hypothetical protein
MLASISDTDFLPLLQFSRSGQTYDSVAVSHTVESDKYTDFITFLGMAQTYGIDLLPIS